MGGLDVIAGEQWWGKMKCEVTVVMIVRDQTSMVQYAGTSSFVTKVELSYINSCSSTKVMTGKQASRRGKLGISLSSARDPIIAVGY